MLPSTADGRTHSHKVSAQTLDSELLNQVRRVHAVTRTNPSRRVTTLALRHHQAIQQAWLCLLAERFPGTHWVPSTHLVKDAR